MSDFQRNIFQNRLRKAEQKLGFDFNESLEDSIPDKNNKENNNNNNNNNNESETGQPLRSSKSDFRGSITEDEQIRLNWNEVFDKNDIYCDSEGYCFQTYFKSPNINRENDNGNDSEVPVIFIGHHGAGSTGLTFTELTKCLQNKSKELKYFTNPGFFTFDMRGHSKTNLINRNNEKLNSLNYNLSIDQLADDFIFIFNHFMKRILMSNLLGENNGGKCSIFFLGHSLGGSVLTKVLYEFTKNPSVSKLNPEYAKFIRGLTMVDIVEDTAIHALHSMDTYLNNLPSSFPNLKTAINWHISHGLIFNNQSCRYSIPAILFKDENGDNNYHFIIDLKKSKQYWENWFIGLSKNFVAIPNSISKILILANNDYLDKDLMIGQMQGKYQLIVFRSSDINNNNNNTNGSSGSHDNLQNFLTTSTNTISVDCAKISHFIHEDVPNKMAISLLEFVERNDNESFHKAQSNPQLELINKLNQKWKAKK